MKIQKFIIKKIIPLLLVSIICIPLVSCKPKNEFICENEDVGEAWEKYVLNYEKNVDLIDIYPPTHYNYTSSIINLERYKVSDKETFDLLMPILIEIGEYATKAENIEDRYKSITLNEISPKCGLIFNPNDLQNCFTVSLYDNMIVVDSDVCFITEENISQLIDEIMQLAKDNGVYTTDIG